MSSAIPNRSLRIILRLTQSQDSKPNPFSLLRRILSIRHTTQHHKSTDQNTGTGDVTREARTGPAQDVTRASSSDDIGDDVVMRGDSVDENRAEHPSSPGSDSRRRTTTKREPREVRDARTSVTEQHDPRRISKKATLSELPVVVTTQEALGRIPRENNEGRERREPCIDLGVLFHQQKLST